MEKMMKMMEEMMEKMCSEERMQMMSGMMEKCFASFSDEEKKDFFKEKFPRPDKDDSAWEMMPRMMMTMMGMMSMMMMRDMMKGPSGGMRPMMGGPMRMMQRMMGGFPGNKEKAEAKKEPAAGGR